MRSNNVAILLGDGKGNFSESSRVAVGIEPRKIWVADLDGDGHEDIVTANGGSNDVSVPLVTVD